jgi:hypothetical protein
VIFFLKKFRILNFFKGVGGVAARGQRGVALHDSTESHLLFEKLKIENVEARAKHVRM